MSHVITVGDLFWPAIVIGGIMTVFIILGIIVSVFADAWKH